MGPEAHLNVRMIGQFVQILAGHLEDGCDLRNALDGCSKFYKIAKYAVHTQRTIRLSRPLDEDQDVRDQLEVRPFSTLFSDACIYINSLFVVI